MRSALKLAGFLVMLGSFAGAGTAAAQGTPPPTPTVTVGGVVYAQYLYQLKDTANHVNNFDITRSYINVIGKFPSGLATRVTADIYRNTDGSLAFRLKYAYAAFTPEGSALTFKLGEIHTPWLDWEEALWDYRMQGQMAMERAGYLSSSDFGAGVDGNWKKDFVNMQVGIYNGENYNQAPGDQRKDAMGRVSVRLLETDDGSRVGGLRLDRLRPGRQAHGRRHPRPLDRHALLQVASCSRSRANTRAPRTGRTRPPRPRRRSRRRRGRDPELLRHAEDPEHPRGDHRPGGPDRSRQGRLEQPA